MRSARRTPRGSGRRTSTSPAARSRASTSSSCAIGRRPRAGTRARRRPRFPPRWSSARGPSTARPTSGSPATRSRAGSRARRADAGARPGPAEGGDPRSTGPGGRAGAAGARLRRRAQRPRRPADRARRRGPGAVARDVRAAAVEPADRGLRDSPVKFGVVRFPGSCDDVDALLAAHRVGDAVILWHADRDLQGVDAVVVPGGFSYGDYLRVGAIARFAPVMEEVAEFARAGGLVLGICNGFQVLCEAGLLPGALLPNTSLRFIFRQVQLEVADADTPFTNRCAEGDTLSIPVKHMSGRFYAPPDQLDALEAGGQVLLRYAPSENPNGSLRDIAGVCNESRNVFGLMPHPEHAVDPLTGSTDGLKLLESMALHVRQPAARSEERRVGKEVTTSGRHP